VIVGKDLTNTSLVNLVPKTAQNVERKLKLTKNVWKHPRRIMNSVILTEEKIGTVHQVVISKMAIISNGTIIRMATVLLVILQFATKKDNHLKLRTLNTSSRIILYVLLVKIKFAVKRLVV
jgi:hypothetical protein